MPMLATAALRAGWSKRCTFSNLACRYRLEVERLGYDSLSRRAVVPARREASLLAAAFGIWKLRSLKKDPRCN